MRRRWQHASVRTGGIALVVTKALPQPEYGNLNRLRVKQKHMCYSNQTTLAEKKLKTFRLVEIGNFPVLPQLSKSQGTG